MNDQTSRRTLPLILLGLLVLATSLPFVNKPFHIDDSAFLEIAQNILAHPLDPFRGQVALVDRDFEVFRERGVVPNTFAGMSHPPLVPYFMAAVIKMTGGISEWPLHAGATLFLLICVFSAYWIAERFTHNGLVATLFFATSPLLMVISQDLMTDIPMLAFTNLALVLFIHGSDREKRSWILLAGVAASLAILSRYVALSVLILFFAYSFLNQKGWRDALLASLIALICLVPWTFENLRHHGAIHFLASTQHYAFFYQSGSFAFRDAILKTIGDCAALGGTAILSLVLMLLLIPSARNIVLTFVSIAIGALLVIINPFGLPLADYSILQQIFLILFFGAGLALILMAIAFSIEQARSEPHEKRSALFLLFWLSLNLIFAIFLLPFGTGRYILPILLPMALILVRQFEAEPKARRVHRIAIAVVLALTLTGGLILCVGDYLFASAYKSYAESFRKNHPGQVWFIGEWGFRYYMMAEGAHYLVSTDDRPAKGDVIVKAEMCGYNWVSPSVAPRVERITRDEVPCSFPVRILNIPAKAGFYSAGYGLLPYAVSRSPLERFEVFRVVR
jgi:4-amino-4-deoxy-L-arabinose transferase-like glycosyltransferase